MSFCHFAKENLPWGEIENDIDKRMTERELLLLAYFGFSVNRLGQVHTSIRQILDFMGYGKNNYCPSLIEKIKNSIAFIDQHMNLQPTIKIKGLEKFKGVAPSDVIALEVTTFALASKTNYAEITDTDMLGLLNMCRTEGLRLNLAFSLLLYFKSHTGSVEVNGQKIGIGGICYQESILAKTGMAKSTYAKYVKKLIAYGLLFEKSNKDTMQPNFYAFSNDERIWNELQQRLANQQQPNIRIKENLRMVQNTKNHVDYH